MKLQLNYLANEQIALFNFIYNLSEQGHVNLFYALLDKKEDGTSLRLPLNSLTHLRSPNEIPPLGSTEHLFEGRNALSLGRKGNDRHYPRRIHGYGSPSSSPE